MTTILDKIIAEKKKEVALIKEARSKSEAPKLENKPVKCLRTFREAVEQSKTMSIIAEIKRASPSKGIINADVDPIKQAKIYADNGVAAISVLTDTPFFKGTMDDLQAVREVVDVPILNKDFIIDAVQIDRAQEAGANIILLIAAALEETTFKQLFDYAKTKGLEVLCEVHDEEELAMVQRVGADIIGINNRNLKTFEVDLGTTDRLAKQIIDPNVIIVSESGLRTRSDIEQVATSGARAILVGETFMRAGDVKAAIEEFQVPLQ